MENPRPKRQGLRVKRSELERDIDITYPGVRKTNNLSFPKTEGLPGNETFSFKTGTVL